MKIWGCVVIKVYGIASLFVTSNYGGCAEGTRLQTSHD